LAENEINSTKVESVPIKTKRRTTVKGKGGRQNPSSETESPQLHQETGQIISALNFYTEAQLRPAKCRQNQEERQPKSGPFMADVNPGATNVITSGEPFT